MTLFKQTVVHNCMVSTSMIIAIMRTKQSSMACCFAEGCHDEVDLKNKRLYDPSYIYETFVKLQA